MDRDIRNVIKTLNEYGEGRKFHVYRLTDSKKPHGLVNRNAGNVMGIVYFYEEGKYGTRPDKYIHRYEVENLAEDFGEYIKYNRAEDKDKEEILIGRDRDGGDYWSDIVWYSFPEEGENKTWKARSDGKVLIEDLWGFAAEELGMLGAYYYTNDWGELKGTKYDIDKGKESTFPEDLLNQVKNHFNHLSRQDKVIIIREYFD